MALVTKQSRRSASRRQESSSPSSSPWFLRKPQNYVPAGNSPLTLETRKNRREKRRKKKTNSNSPPPSPELPLAHEIPDEEDPIRPVSPKSTRPPSPYITKTNKDEITNDDLLLPINTETIDHAVVVPHTPDAISQKDSPQINRVKERHISSPKSTRS